MSTAGSTTTTTAAAARLRFRERGIVPEPILVALLECDAEPTDLLATHAHGLVEQHGVADYLGVSEFLYGIHAALAKLFRVRFELETLQEILLCREK